MAVLPYRMLLLSFPKRHVIMGIDLEIWIIFFSCLSPITGLFKWTAVEIQYLYRRRCGEWFRRGGPSLACNFFLFKVRTSCRGVVLSCFLSVCLSPLLWREAGRDLSEALRLYLPNAPHLLPFVLFSLYHLSATFKVTLFSLILSCQCHVIYLFSCTFCSAAIVWRFYLRFAHFFARLVCFIGRLMFLTSTAHSLHTSSIPFVFKQKLRTKS